MSSTTFPLPSLTHGWLLVSPVTTKTSNYAMITNTILLVTGLTNYLECHFLTYLGPGIFTHLIYLNLLSNTYSLKPSQPIFFIILALPLIAIDFSALPAFPTTLVMQTIMTWFSLFFFHSPTIFSVPCASCFPYQIIITIFHLLKPLFGSAAASAASLAVQVCRGLFCLPCLLKRPVSQAYNFIMSNLADLTVLADQSN
jgi:hypothetical protein